jgi:hypothetical protein
VFPVRVGLNDPQATDPHAAVQITPAPTGSFVVAAVSSAAVFTSMELGTAVEKEIAIGVDSIVRLTLLLCEGLLVTVALMVTEVPIGATDGAVKTVTAPSAVCAGASVPHAPLVMLPIPALIGSPEGIMPICSVEATSSALG